MEGRDMDYIAYCTVCGELNRAPNGPMMESTARLHRMSTSHMTLLAYEPPESEEEIRKKFGPEEPSRTAIQTYSDWSNLAEDIKSKYPDDPVMRASVNFQLNRILEEEREPEEEREARREEAQEAKRWMTEQAGELGLE